MLLFGDDLVSLIACFFLFRYIYYYENDNPVIQVRYISGLVQLINEQASGAEGQSVTPAAEAHYKNTLGKHTC